MLQSHLVNDENLVVLLGHLLPTVGDVAAAMLGVDLNTTKCKRLSETTRYFYIRDKVVCIISRHVQAIENVVVLYVNVNIPCPQQRSPRVWPGQCREDHWSHCTRPGQLQWGCDLGGKYIRTSQLCHCCHLSSDLTIGGVHPGQVTVTRSYQDLRRERGRECLYFCEAEILTSYSSRLSSSPP